MKKNFLLVLAIFSFISLRAQTFPVTFTGAAAVIPGTSTTQKCFPLTVSGIGVITASGTGLAQVCIDITHPNVDELEIVLTAPDGTVVPLTMQNGGSGDNYAGTCFTATATQSIKFGTAPFNGTYSPEGHLGAVNNGQNANGVWNLCIQDRRTGANAGTLNSYALIFSTAPAPLPVSLPACTYTLPGTSSCANATTICDFNGLCGTTSGTTVQNWAGSGLNGCFGLENNSFVKFTASATTASFSVWVPTNTIPGNYNLGGIQMLFFSGTCNSGAVTTYGCYPHILPYSAPGKPIISVVTASGLTPGNTYYLMIDGFNSDHCSFTIEAISGVSILNVSPATASICQGESINLTASGANGIFSWSPSGTLSASAGAVVTATPASTTTYTVASTGVGSCAITKDVTVSVNALPVINIQPAAAAQNVCLNGPVAALNVSAVAGSGTITTYQWYSNTTASNTGGTLIAGATVASYSPSASSIGTTYYYCIITNSNTCSTVSAVSGAVIINAAVATPTAAVFDQPTCAIPNGSIRITAPVGGNIQYSIGGAYQGSGIFNGTLPGTYNVTARDVLTGCTSLATSVTVNPVPGAPDQPVAAVTTQPTCALPTGTIQVVSPAAANLLYSIGGAYQTGGFFSGLAANTYNVTVKDNNTGCISPSLQLIVNPATGAPGVPTGSVTVQPTCAIPTGTIQVTGPTGANIQYSIGGTYQTSGLFTGLAANSYNVTAKDVVSGCISAVFPLVVNAVAGVPAIPVATVTVQPGCNIATGTIVITAPVAANIEYSIGGLYQGGGTFTNLAPNTYNVTVKNIATGCISPVLQLTVDPVPAPPAIATASVSIQPDCIVPTGTIVITQPTGTNIQYSTGAAYQTSGTFPGLLPGTYNITVKNTTTGCISGTLPLTVNVVPGAPAIPAGSISIQPTCSLPTGTIVITGPTGTNIQYSSGGAYQGSTVFPGLLPNNTYTFTAKDITTGCISPGLQLSIGPIPGLPNVPVTTGDSRCGQGAVNLTATGTGITWYSDAALISPVATGNNFTPVINQTTTWYVTASNNNCISTAATVTGSLNPLPVPVLGADRSICLDDKLILNPGVFNNYLWQDNSLLPTFTVTASNTYIVTVRNNAGCENTASVKITVLTDCNDIYFPAAFTPNADGRNDEFGPLPISALTLVSNYNLIIYNRYGQKVFQSYDPYKKWTGKFYEKITAGNYSWYATYNFRGISKVNKGNILIIR